MVPGRHFSNDLSGWGRTARPATADRELPQLQLQPCRTEACWEATVAPLAEEVPVVTGEFGELDCTASYVRSFMKSADRHGVGYLSGRGGSCPVRSARRSPCSPTPGGSPRAERHGAQVASVLAGAARVAQRTQGADARRSGGGRRALLGSVRRERHGPAPRQLPPEAPLASAASPRDPHARSPVPRKARRAAAAALRADRTVSARITVVVSDGSESTERRRVVRLTGTRPCGRASSARAAGTRTARGAPRPPSCA